MYCPNCGSSVAEGSEHCPRCGMQLSGSGSARAASTGSSLSSSYFNREGSAQAEHLAQVVRDALREFGMGVLKNPRRLAAYASDFIPEEDRVGSTFMKQCDEEFLSIYDMPANRRSSSDLETAALKATQFLSEERMIVPRMASTVSESVAQGIADHLGLQISFGGDIPHEQEVHCPHCGIGNAPENSNCAACGRPLRDEVVPPTPSTPPTPTSPSTPSTPPTPTSPLPSPIPVVICPSCNAQNDVNNEFCASCGHRLRGKEPHKRYPILVGVIVCLALAFIGYIALPKSSITNDSQSNSVVQRDSGGNVDKPSDGTTESAVEEEGSYPPVFSSANASSTLIDSDDPDKYAPQQVLDGSRQTCWSQGNRQTNWPESESDETIEEWQNGTITGSFADSCAGVGEYIELSAKEKQRLSGFKIINGFSRMIPDDMDSSNGRSYYYWNPRVKDATIELSDGYSQNVTFGDEGPGDWQIVEFDEPHNTTFLRIFIKSVYDTNKDGTGRCNWPDTCIDEIEVF